VISTGRPARLLLPLILVSIVAVACGSSGPSFDPTGPCLVDGQVAGAYPELEAAIPSTLRGEPSVSLDSGRSCSAGNLGTLAGHGVTELRFAGGLWEVGDRSGVTIARFTAPGLESAWMAEFYETGARAGRKTEEISVSRPPVGGGPGWRLDTLNDESFQTIVVWSDDEPGAVWVVLAASGIREVATRAEHDSVVADAIAEAAGP
jgi:hypothetical protein